MKNVILGSAMLIAITAGVSALAANKTETNKTNDKGCCEETTCCCGGNSDCCALCCPGK